MGLISSKFVKPQSSHRTCAFVMGLNLTKFQKARKYDCLFSKVEKLKQIMDLNFFRQEISCKKRSMSLKSNVLLGQKTYFECLKRPEIRISTT